MIVVNAFFVMNYLLLYAIKTKQTFCSELMITLVVFSNTTYKNVL